MNLDISSTKEGNRYKSYGRITWPISIVYLLSMKVEFQGYRDLTGFIREVNQAVIGVRTSDSVSIPAASSSLLGIFDVLKVSRCFDIHF